MDRAARAVQECARVEPLVSTNSHRRSSANARYVGLLIRGRPRSAERLPLLKLSVPGDEQPLRRQIGHVGERCRATEMDLVATFELGAKSAGASRWERSSVAMAPHRGAFQAHVRCTVPIRFARARLGPSYVPCGLFRAAKRYRPNFSDEGAFVTPVGLRSKPIVPIKHGRKCGDRRVSRAVPGTAQNFLGSPVNPHVRSGGSFTRSGMSNKSEPKARPAKPDPRVVVGTSVDAYEDSEIVRKVQDEPDYLKRADDALRDAVAKNLSMMLP